MGLKMTLFDPPGGVQNGKKRGLDPVLPSKIGLLTHKMSKMAFFKPNSPLGFGLGGVPPLRGGSKRGFSRNSRISQKVVKKGYPADTFVGSCTAIRALNLDRGVD